MAKVWIPLWLGLLAPMPGVAQSYPAKSIRMIIPAPPGGGVDTIGRAVGQKMSEVFNQPVVQGNCIK